MRSIAFYFFFIVVLTQLTMTEYKYLKYMLAVWSVLTLIAVGKACMQKFFGFNAAENYWLFVLGGRSTHIIHSGVRYFSFFSDAANFGGSMGLSMVVFSISALYYRNSWMKLYLLLVAAAACYGMLISGTRSALAVPFVGYSAFIMMSRNIKMIGAGVFLIIAAFIFLKFTTIGQGNSIIRRARSAFNTNDPSFQVRLANQAKLRELMADKPFGAGLGHGGGKAKTFAPNAALSQIPTDSWFVMVWVETGVVGILLHIGILLYMGKSEKRKGIGTILIGFAILMTGMTTMSNAVEPLQGEAWFTNLFVRFSNPILGVLVGALVTGIIQSSSASVGILQALSATGVITYGSAIPIIMGQNIGTCVTALISSVGANKNARRAAMVHLYFNIIGVTVFLAGFYGLNAVVHFDFVNETIAAWGIAVVHSAFNIAATLILLPFANGLEKLAILTIPDDAEKESFALLDERLLNTPAVAVARAHSATADMAELARVGVMQAMSLTHTWDDTLAQKVRDEESKVDQYEDALGTYLVKLSSRELNHADSQSVNTLLHTISDFERISDHSVNLLESAQEMHTKEINFSTDAREELQVLEDAVQDVLNRTTDAFRKDDLHLASKVEPLETVVDELVRAIKARHVARLQAGSCSIEYGFVLEDLLTNYERVCDHCSNVAVAQIEVAQDSFDTHAYLNDLRHGKDTKESEEFHRRLDKYRERYLFPDNQSAEEFDK